jgi:outer membrane receptor for ferrienterochelin and colicin
LKRRCLCCERLFTPLSQVPHQQYCSCKRCQNGRRQRWRKQKLSNDPDYKANQEASQQRWCKKNPDYWQCYRASHPKYNQRNRKLQRLRNQKRHVDGLARIAKRYVSSDQIEIKSGVYNIVPVDGSSIAKRYAFIAKLDVISGNYAHAP